MILAGSLTMRSTTILRASLRMRSWMVLFGAE